MSEELALISANAAWCDECRSIRMMRVDELDDSKGDSECPYVCPVDLVCSEGHVIATLYNRKTA